MLKLEDIKVGAQIVGLTPNELATVVAVAPAGNDAVTVYYKTPTGIVNEQFLFRDSAERLSLAQKGLAWSFDSPSQDFKLALEAMRIEMGYLFDPLMAIHTSNVDPLPHQISAVYEAMLPKHPLRFVLADDPGAGKTIMAARLQKRLAELKRMRNVVSNTPVVLGGILVIPQGLLNKLSGDGTFSTDPLARTKVEKLAMNAVMEVERGFGYEVRDVSAEKCGWDVSSYPPHVDPFKPMPNARHIEVNGREKGAETVTLSRDEICYAVNQKDKFILALVLVDGNEIEGPYYIRNFFDKEPNWAQDSINYNIKDLLSIAVKPEETV